MAWFKSNKVETRIANILKGTSDPASSIGDNGQLYLKYYDYSNDYSFREYLEVTSVGPYINTEVACTSNAYFEVDFNFTGSHSESRVFGCGTGGGAMFLIQNYNIDYISAGASSVSDVYQIPDANNRHKYKANADGIYVDDVLVDTNVHWDNALPQRHYNLFAIDWDGTAYYATNTRVYSCRIWNGTKIVRYLLPALRKSDDVVGMFDIVNGIFYTNSGSGSFTISSTEINIGNTIIDSFAKVNDAWQNLIGTNIGDILAGGSKYIKATGSFTSASSGGQKVEVNCGFKPDLVMVDMEFGNGFTRATYLSTAWYEETDHPASVWDLRPMENVIYAIVPGSVNGETGITDLTDTGFKYRSNGSNTTNKACTYTAIKFDVEEQTDDRTYLFKDGEWKNQDILSLYGYNTTIENGSLKCTGAHAGVVVDDVSGLDSSVTQYSVYLKVRAGNVNSYPLQTGRNVPTQNLYDIIQYGTDRYSYNTDYISSGTDYLFILIALYNTDGVFLGAQNSDENAYYYIDEIWLETSAQVIVHS